MVRWCDGGAMVVVHCCDGRAVCGAATGMPRALLRWSCRVRCCVGDAVSILQHVRPPLGACKRHLQTPPAMSPARAAYTHRGQMRHLKAPHANATCKRHMQTLPTNAACNACCKHIAYKRRVQTHQLQTQRQQTVQAHFARGQTKSTNLGVVRAVRAARVRLSAGVVQVAKSSTKSLP